MYCWEDISKKVQVGKDQEKAQSEKDSHSKTSVEGLNVHLDQKGLIPESQCGFRKDRGTIVMIFTARQLQEKCQEQNIEQYIVDLTNAFDKISRDGLQKFMTKFGCPPKIYSSGAAIS